MEAVTPQQRYERDAGTVFVTGDGMEKRDLISYRNDYQILTEGSRSGTCQLQLPERGGRLSERGSKIALPRGRRLSHNPRRVGVLLLLTGFADGWLVWVDEVRPR